MMIFVEKVGQVVFERKQCEGFEMLRYHGYGLQRSSKCAV